MVEDCRSGIFFCEAALWTRWTPIGSAEVIQTNATILDVDAKEFQAIACDLQAIPDLGINTYEPTDLMSYPQNV